MVYYMLLPINTVFYTFQQFSHFCEVAKIKETNAQQQAMILCILNNSGRMEKYLDLREDENAVKKTWSNLIKLFCKAHIPCDAIPVP